MAAEADDAFARQLQALRREYLADSPKRVAELQALSARLARGDLGALADCRQAFHRLAGSGGSYGFPRVSTTSREAEHLVERLAAAGIGLAPSDIAAIDACIVAVARAFDDASATLGQPGA
jgi:chemotaxis protein histidine kinase CheA